MAAQVDGGGVHLSAERLEDGLVGDGIETGRVQEQHVDRPHRIAKGDP